MRKSSCSQYNEEVREEIYEELNVSSKEKMGIKYILPIYVWMAQTDAKYEINNRSKILAEIVLIRAYIKQPKLKIFTSVAVLLLIYDHLHSMNPSVYGILLGAIATLYGFIATFRSPETIAAELEGAKDSEGMPAHYHTKAHSIVNTNITLVLFVIAIGIQLVVTSSMVEGELLTSNVVDGILHSWISALVLALLPIVRVLWRDDE